MAKIKIRDRVEFEFAGSKLTGSVSEFYKSNEKAMIDGDDGFIYPTSTSTLKKIQE